MWFVIGEGKNRCWNRKIDLVLVVIGECKKKDVVIEKNVFSFGNKRCYR